MTADVIAGPVIYTYFVPLWDEENQRKLIEVWAQSWEKRGWQTRVLGLEEAQQHPRFDEFDTHVSALPTVNAPEYERQCYLRWLALAAMGGGVDVGLRYDQLRLLSPDCR